MKFQFVPYVPKQDGPLIPTRDRNVHDVVDYCKSTEDTLMDSSNPGGLNNGDSKLPQTVLNAETLHQERQGETHYNFSTDTVEGNIEHNKQSKRRRLEDSKPSLDDSNSKALENHIIWEERCSEPPHQYASNTAASNASHPEAVGMHGAADTESPPKSTQDDVASESSLDDEWEGKIIGEEGNKYMVKWEPSLIHKSLASKFMIDKWQEKKREMIVTTAKKAVKESRDCGNEPAQGDVKASTGIKRKRGRPRKLT
ncbi:hypothetical protein JX265_009808 [Neoarthrinium moseri]|uniref:Uncharacterized protein n=1 Tax=Neoarthrinium moseri TaxID=1658444 RepID=A0A9P9WF24_9PEZI|nr:hypothetical protein JX265_009808 [Neoarthrinium moseri]